MGDLDKNIHRREDPAPYEKIIVNPIEKDKKEGQENYTSLKNTTKYQTLATVVSFFKHALTSLTFKGKGLLSLENEQQLFENIEAFKQLLIILSNEDQSHNPDFTKQLSEVWHNLLEECNSFSSFSLSFDETVDKIKFFVSQVKDFPLGADHTLGFYFDEYAGKDWIPFPFMELLQGLHEEYNASPAISVLMSWISLLNDILMNLDLKID